MVVDLITRGPLENLSQLDPSINRMASKPPLSEAPIEGSPSGSQSPPSLGTPTLDPIGASIGASIGGSGFELMDSLVAELAIEKPDLSAEEETESPYTHKRWEVTTLKPRHREMMRRVAEGSSYIEIAADMGLSPQTVILVCSSAIFKEELRILESGLSYNVIRRAEEMSNEALDKLKGLMRRARSEALQASCAEKVLGIAGYSKIEKKQIAVVSGEDVIRELNKRRREDRVVSREDSFSSGSNARSNDSSYTRAIVEAEIDDLS